VTELLLVRAPARSWVQVETGIRSWLLTHDHKRVGVLFFLGTTFWLLVGGVFALLLRTHLLEPEGALVDYATYDRLFTLHGITMVFLFMIPAVPGAFGNFLLPLMIGARDVAFPRLNLASFWTYFVGAAFVTAGIALGGADTGWTFYPPYSSSTPSSLAPIVVGIFLVGTSSVMSGINFIVTIHTLRAEGVTWGRVPVFAWTLYSTSVIQILATPVLGMSLVLVAIDYLFSWGIFDPARGGDPVLFQHLFWFYSHPAVYIMILPAQGIMAEVVCSHAHRSPLSYTVLVVSSLGIAFTGFLTWGHHMFTAGISRFDAGVFGVLSMFVGIFSAIKVFTWVGTLYKGQIVFNTPLLYFFAFLFLFVFGGMTGVALATVSLDLHWQDTYFVVAHFHFIMVGGVITAWLAALHHWFPKVTGRMYSESWGLLTAALVFMGFFLTFFPQFLLGNLGMPRRWASYPAKFTPLHVLSTGGAWLLGTSLLIVLGYISWALIWGERAERNPWSSASYEWLAPTPLPRENFDEPPVFDRGPYDYDRMEA
jgi:cytochrome c oxidase subunit 1